MKNRFYQHRLARSIVIIAVLLSSIDSVYAVDVPFFQSNDIVYFDPNAAGACVVKPGARVQGGVSAAGNGANENRDYKGDEVISAEHMEKIKKNQPIYEKASTETGVPWQIFAVLHIRESVLADYNPGNGQGIYQDYERAGNGGEDYPPGPVTDEEFLRQTVYAGKIVEEKAGSKFDLVKQGDADAIKDMFFGYNGRATGYKDQAVALGFSEEEANRGEGSPYVMNIADAKRDPEVAGEDGTWGQVKRDRGPIEYPANGDHGAFIMYGALAGIASTGGSCTNGRIAAGSPGPNGWDLSAMKLFYQIKEPWASMSYGGRGSIINCGCTPTSIAMAIASLTGLPEEEVNPKIVADLMSSTDGQLADCSSWLPGPGREYTKRLSEEYGLVFTELGTDRTKAIEAIKRGSLIVVSGQSTLGGHVFLIRGVTDDGRFLVADPASEENTSNENGLELGDYNPGIPVKDLVVKNGFWEVRKA